MDKRHHKFWPPGQPKSLPPCQHSVFEFLTKTAARHGDRQAINYYGGTLSFTELMADVDRLAGYLHHRVAIQPDDRVAIFMQNAPQYAIAYYAILGANAVIVPISPMSREGELSHILADAGVSALIYGQELSKVVEAASPDCSLVPVCYGEYANPDNSDRPAVVAEAPKDAPGTPWRDALAAELPPPAHNRTPEDWCIIPYSSGTTGRPKGCLHAHSSIAAIIQAYPRWVGHEPGSRILATLPYCHVTGMQHSLNLPISTGSTIHLMTRWDAAYAAKLIERERIQYWRSITTMMIDFLSLPGIETRDLSSLVAIGGGGAQMPEAVAQKMADLIGLDYVEGYGMSETAAPTHVNPPQAPRKQCLGIPIFDVDARVLDTATGALLGPNETGEIVVNGPQVFLGYWQNPEATAEAFLEIDGKKFLRTGDIGYFDEDGYFYFVDRLKRMVNVSGLKVWPAEVEAILHGHPLIEEAAIVGDPDPRTGEAVRAVIVLGSGADQPSVADLTKWCRANMAAYKIPQRFEFRDALPRSAAGKVLWKDL